LQIEASWLRLHGNRITLIPLGIGGIEYDAVSLRKAHPPGDGGIGALALEPTVFYRKQDGKLVETCRLIVPFEKGFVKGSATVQVGDFKTSKALEAPGYDLGSLMESVEIEPPAGSAKATLTANLDGHTQRAKHSFTPAKQRKVYICPMIHNDVGYTGIQPQVNELDTRDTDTVLDILDTYPFYKFNFETGWLVDNFLDSRPSGERQRFLERARQRRLGLNAFYLNLLTGLCSGEELYRAVYFAYRMHKEHGSNFSFASLTDAPSHTWFLPSLLTDVGIKVFANGSNQTRAPILQFSNLNDDSPFYWERVNGERIMMWYSRSYAQLRRLTAPTFTSRVSSYEYLQRAVPQFLLRYLRQDYAPDAVMIYGAYVDNSAIPKTAEAPLIARWNQEYEFPRLIVATDDEYFHYISNHFAGRLPVYRGDAGAYWEDGAGSTSRTTKLDRHKHLLLPTAETVASFATLFEPRNRYPKEKFRSAWNNTLFYDEHTWGAYNSTRQPDREFVTRQWEIKKSYATRANLDARKLLTRSLNRLFQQMHVKGDTIFAMNMENWKRPAPVEVEIDDGNYLFDLSSPKPVPLDVVFKKDGWRRVRFLASDVPAMG
jgi:alpha-mannosidase